MTILTDDRADRRHSFRAQSLSKRYPHILQRTLKEVTDASVVAAMGSLAGFIAGDHPLSIPVGLDDPYWLELYQRHEGVRVPDIDFLTLEYLLFHQILLAHRYFDEFKDPFANDKRLDLADALPAYALAFDGLTDLPSALMVSLLGNAHDASQLHIKTDGRVLDLDALPEAVGASVVDIICDNAGHEYLSDLALAAYLLRTTTSNVRLHVKAMPWFVSDVTQADTVAVFDAIEASPGRYSAWGSTLMEGRQSSRLEINAHPHWTRPVNFGEGNLIDALGTRESLVIVKGDLNYRRCLADISTDIFTPWRSLPYLPDVPVVALRSVKSHCWAGVSRDKWPEDFNADHFPMDGTLFCTQTMAPQ